MVAAFGRTPFLRHMKLLKHQAWSDMTAAVRRAPERCRVAVAYFGKGASWLLPLRRGSVLVLDFSERAVRAGHACPEEVLVRLRRGAAWRSIPSRICMQRSSWPGARCLWVRRTPPGPRRST